MFLLLLSSLEERELFLNDESKSLFFLEGIVVVEKVYRYMQETKYGISISQYMVILPFFVFNTLHLFLESLFIIIRYINNYPFFKKIYLSSSPFLIWRNDEFRLPE